VTRAKTPEVLLYTRSECGLCDDAAAILRTLQAEFAFTTRVIDIDADPALRARFHDTIPVIVVGETIVAQAPIDPAALRKALSRALR
jgi:thioredoxin reductase (NADPH)